MPQDRIKLAVVIVNYRTAHLVVQCLDSLQSELADVNARVIVVDNRSQDDSLPTLRKWIAAHDAGGLVQVIEAGSNSGFSAGNNVGIRAVDADYYLLLNSDTIVRPEATRVLLETADSHPRAGIVSPRLEWPDATPQESCFRYASPWSELVDAAQTGPVTALFDWSVVALPVSDSIVMPQWTSFACVLVRREVIEQIGLMDDGFFMYFEDVEYCRRTREAGWDIVHNPKARVVHLRGGSSPVKQRTIERKRLPRYYYAARARYFYLGYGWLGLTLANVLWTLGRCVSRVREIVERRGRGVPDRQWLDIWTNWLKPAVPWAEQKKN
jgi:N-acetylglucosaminyl-diphospho-decaprenol L-rhamnosyltransferase